MLKKQPPRVGSTAWYREMSQKLNACSSEIAKERYKRLSIITHKAGSALHKWMEERFKDIPFPDFGRSFYSPNKPLIFACLSDVDKISAHAANHMPPMLGGIDIIPFPHLEEGKMIFHMPDGSMLNEWLECKNFSDLPIAMSKTTRMSREEFSREFPYEKAWTTPAPGTIRTAEENRIKRQSDAYMKIMALIKQQKEDGFFQLKPILKSDLENISPENQKTLDLYKGIHEGAGLFSKMISARIPPSDDPTKYVREFIEENIPAEHKTFEGKVFYIGKYKAFVKVRNRWLDELKLSGLTEFFNDASTDVVRQKITIRKFQDLSPIEIDPEKLHMYSSFIVYKEWEHTEGGAWKTKEEHETILSSVIDEAEALPWEPGEASRHIIWPEI